MTDVNHIANAIDPATDKTAISNPTNWFSLTPRKTDNLYRPNTSPAANRFTQTKNAVPKMKGERFTPPVYR